MATSPSSNSPHELLRGIAASPGVALGPAFVYAPVSASGPSAASGKRAQPADQEKAALRDALAQASAQLLELGEQVSREVSQAEGAIFEAQAMMLQDPTLTESAEQLIETQGDAAASAITQAVEEQAQQLESIEDQVIAARSADLRDALQRVLRILQGVQTPDLAEQLAASGASVILVARDLRPSETARLRAGQVLGICTAVGGATAHAAILARALGIPAVMGVGEELLARVRTGMALGLDGTQGQVYLEPDVEVRARFLGEMQHQQTGAEQRKELAAHWRARPGATADGRRLMVLANIGSGGPEEAREAVETWGAEGVGLLRTEFLFGDRPTLSDEDEQFEQYRALFRAFADQAPSGAPMIVRTLDAGADKPLPALASVLGEAKEENPALGLRGIRIHLAYPDLLLAQVRALLRAAGETSVALQLMFPMIATLDEFRRARALFDQAHAGLVSEGKKLPAPVPVGMMVEVPSAVVLAGPLAREADFFSIGTNDLTQYLLAADRLHGGLGGLYDVLQPAVLRAIAAVAEAAHAAGRLVAVCGEAAGDPRIGPLLVGLGIDELSMVPGQIPLLKDSLSRSTTEQLAALARQALEMVTVDAVQSLVNATLHYMLPRTTKKR